MRVLFICVHNSARSQMAEAFLNRLGAGKFIAESAGIESGTLNPLVVKAMAEIGYDIANNKTKSVDSLLKEKREFDIVVKVCSQAASEKCPIFPSQRVSLNWDLKDPAELVGSNEKKFKEICKIRDSIKQHIEEFIATYKS